MKESLFMGKVTAAMTHEMKNVLAIISEAAGLAQDLLGPSDESVFPLKNRFLNIMGKIDNQVTRGSDILGVLNYFSHVPDDEQRQENLDEVLNQTLFLSRKISRLNGVDLVTEQTDSPVILDYNPLKSRMLLYRMLEFLAPLVGKGSEIMLRAWRFHDGSAGVCFTVKASASSTFSLTEMLNGSSWGALETEFRTEKASIGPSGNNSLMLSF
ncbi:MAG: hypothetical protein M1511_13845 [Deltaproteobacteria bacterium]|jgi:signal transduction histidine kinase|nr:hypothetical protein [Deltaproteobacteria bacterium]